MFKRVSAVVLTASVIAFASSSAAAAGATRKVTISVENLAPGASVAISGLSFAIHQGVFDTFDAGLSPTAAIIPIAELGSGSVWLPTFAAGDSTATTGVVGDTITPGQSSTLGGLMIDTGLDQYFSFGAMVVPSNDHFIGNDDPTQYRLFDDTGHLLIQEIVLTASDIWDAGSEVFAPANAAFIAGSDPTQRIVENGVVRHDFAEYGQFDGLTTAAGYTFQNGLAADTAIYRIHFNVAAVPEPATWAMMIVGFGLIGSILRRRAPAQSFANA